MRERRKNMFIADGWKDYRVLDTGGGMKLESWAGITLARPDPQVIWEKQRPELWKKAAASYARSHTGGGHWDFFRELPERWTVSYGDLSFYVRPTGFKHTGLFPEQSANWDFMAEKIRRAGREPRVLNLFAYTGGATLACAAAGASVTHVDAAKSMVAWAKENAALSGLSDRPIRYIVDDCMKFVQREQRRGKTYDAILMDPPSYGRGPGGEVWKLEEQIYPLVEQCAALLSDKPLFFIINAYTAGLSPSVMRYILGVLLEKRFGGTASADEIGLPVANSGLTLPCGATAIWKG